MLSRWRFFNETGGVVLFAVLIRWMVSVNTYSGKGVSPMYGDFEAQRHWMEIAWNLPVEDWYRNSTDNDLSYWGLDYPPLTAYHSWLCGYIANKINPDWVALTSSRGYESKRHKLFMRATVVIADLLIYIPAICCLVYQRRTAHGGFPYVMQICCEIFVALMSPGLILIDHGHFQYNCISLGLTAWAVFAINRNNHIVGAVLFSLALNYKQMSLYHALPFFFYLLGLCWKAPLKHGIPRLGGLAVAVLTTFAICWLPYVWNLQDVGQVLHRIFPFARGIFEDKVANVWCAVNVVLKLRRWDVARLASLSTIFTLAVSSFSCIDLVRRPNDQRFKYALLNCSLTFFLFSFQVHEKSILLAALPATLLLADNALACTWFLSATALSMFPLLLRDGLALPTYALVVLFLVSSRAFLDWNSKAVEDADDEEADDFGFDISVVMMSFSLIGYLALCLLCQFAPVFPKLPDLWPLLLSVYSCMHFILFLIYFHIRQFSAETVLSKRKPGHSKAE